VQDRRRPQRRESVSKTAAIIIFAAITGLAGYFFGFNRAEAENEFRVRSAALDYATQLRDAIMRAERSLNSGPGVTDGNVRVYGRSILKIRDDLRDSLKSLSDQLNSELDKLSSLIDQYEKTSTEDTAARGALGHDITVTIRVLYETWPSRQLKIDSAVRKVMIDLGLERIYYRDRQTAFLRTE
jgi:hypothetical protein